MAMTWILPEKEGVLQKGAKDRKEERKAAKARAKTKEKGRKEQAKESLVEKPEERAAGRDPGRQILLGLSQQLPFVRDEQAFKLPVTLRFILRF